MLFMLTLLFCLCLPSFCSTQRRDTSVRNQAPLLNVTSDSSGGVVISVEGTAWLRSTDKPWVFHGLWKRRDLTLLSYDAHASGASVGLGAYTAQRWDWSGASLCDGGVALRTELRRYATAGPNAVVFVQEFPCGVPSVEVLLFEGRLASGWPTFEDLRRNSTWTTFNGYFAANVRRGVGLSKCSVGRQGGPLLYFDENTLQTLVLSQLTWVKAGEFDCRSAITLGLKGSLTSIPSGFSASWLLQVGTGIAETMEQWGDVLLACGEKKRVSVYQDDIVSSLGYWTDNGAYYHYPTAGPTLQAGGYQSEIARAHQANLVDNLPYRHWQLDSWWYQKGKGGNGSSRGRGPIGPFIGTYEWTADPFVFPRGGVPAIQSVVGLPFVLHNRWFSPDNWYRRQNIPSSGWTATRELGSLGTLPLDGDYFWEYFFGRQQGYGLKVYEQDFLWTQYDIVPALRRNATLADNWLRSMASAAQRHNLTIQYCMPYPRDYIASTKHAVVTTIRATDDYKPNNANWRIARQSLLAFAVGLLPFKDTFLSSGVKEEGAANPGPELTPELQTLVSTLSGAMVGPGDGPHLANRTRILQTCMDNGILLKADRPAVPIDVVWTSRDPGGELSWSFSSLKGGRAHRYVFAAALDREYDVTVKDLRLPVDEHFVARNWYTGELRAFDVSTPLLLSTRPSLGSSNSHILFQYSTIGTVIERWVLLGELSKYITASTRRITSVGTIGTGSLSITVSGVDGEFVRLCALHVIASLAPVSGNILCHSVTIDSTAQAMLTFHPVDAVGEDGTIAFV